MGSTFHNDLHSMIHSSWGNTQLLKKFLLNYGSVPI